MNGREWQHETVAKEVSEEKNEFEEREIEKGWDIWKEK